MPARSKAKTKKVQRISPNRPLKLLVIRFKRNVNGHVLLLVFVVRMELS